MVIGERFAWAHLGKAAGTATRAMLTAVPGLVLYAAPIDSIDKHDPFWRHEAAIEGKLRAMNIRRLPSFVLSHAHHQATTGVWPDFEALPLASAEEMADSSEPDEMLRDMTDGPRLPVDRWLRTEHLSEDVTALVAELEALTRAARKGIAAVPWVGKPYNHQVASTFTPELIRHLYERNPDWAEAERSAYGGLHELAGL